MKILITGHRGFIGQNMIRALKDKHTLTLFEWGDPYPQVATHDWVIHLGANSSTTETDVELVMRQNYDFSRWLLDECFHYSINLQYSSSASVYGKSGNFKEDGPVNPLSPYAWSKYLFDRYVMKNAIKHADDFFIQGFRYFNVYGPHEDHKGDQASPYTKFKKQAIETGEIKVFENSERYLRDFIHVDEVVKIHAQFFSVRQSGVWNVGTGKTTSFLDVAKQVANETGARIRTIPMPEKLKGSYQEYTCADLESLNGVLYSN